MSTAPLQTRMPGHRTPRHPGEPHLIVVSDMTSAVQLARVTTALLDLGDDVVVRWQLRTDHHLPLDGVVERAGHLLNNYRGPATVTTITDPFDGFTHANAPRLFPVAS